MKDKRKIPVCFFILFFILYASASFAAEKSAVHSPRITFINTGLGYLGTPYRFGGKSAKGMDCSGLIYRTVLTAFKKKVPRRSDALAKFTKKIRDEDIQPGDLLFFKTTHRISHVGIYLGAGQFLHAASDGPHTGVIISNLGESYWRKTYVLAGRLVKEEPLFSTEAVGTHIMLRTENNCTVHPAIKIPK